MNPSINGILEEEIKRRAKRDGHELNPCFWVQLYLVRKFKLDEVQFLKEKKK